MQIDFQRIIELKNLCLSRIVLVKMINYVNLLLAIVLAMIQSAFKNHHNAIQELSVDVISNEHVLLNQVFSIHMNVFVFDKEKLFSLV